MRVCESQCESSVRKFSARSPGCYEHESSIERTGCEVARFRGCHPSPESSKVSVPVQQCHRRQSNSVNSVSPSYSAKVNTSVGHKEGTWVRDLTADGDVESNPGMATSALTRGVGAVAERTWADIARRPIPEVQPPAPPTPVEDRVLWVETVPTDYNFPALGTQTGASVSTWAEVAHSDQSKLALALAVRKNSEPPCGRQPRGPRQCSVLPGCTPQTATAGVNAARTAARTVTASHPPQAAHHSRTWHGSAETALSSMR